MIYDHAHAIAFGTNKLKSHRQSNRRHSINQPKHNQLKQFSCRLSPAVHHCLKRQLVQTNDDLNLNRLSLPGSLRHGNAAGWPFRASPQHRQFRGPLGTEVNNPLRFRVGISGSLRQEQSGKTLGIAGRLPKERLTIRSSKHSASHVPPRSIACCFAAPAAAVPISNPSSSREIRRATGRSCLRSRAQLPTTRRA